MDDSPAAARVQHKAKRETNNLTRVIRLAGFYSRMRPYSIYTTATTEGIISGHDPFVFDKK